MNHVYCVLLPDVVLLHLVWIPREVWILLFELGEEAVPERNLILEATAVLEPITQDFTAHRCILEAYNCGVQKHWVRCPTSDNIRIWIGVEQLFDVLVKVCVRIPCIEIDLHDCPNLWLIIEDGLQGE